VWRLETAATGVFGVVGLRRLSPGLYHRSVTDKKDDESDGTVDQPSSVPPTRRHESTPAADAGEPPTRQSVHDMMNPVMTYPDDGDLSAKLRRVDRYAGLAEQGLMVALLAVVILLATSQALGEKIAHADLWGTFKDDAVRAGTFAMALIGGAYATHQGRHLAMDLISRRMAPRARLVLSVLLGLFVIMIVALLIRAGFHTIDAEAEIAKSASGSPKLITSVHVAYLIPIGGALVIFHTLLHLLIDVDYIIRGKTPPEKMRTGH
jgi:TRAP-type C4-dicarboxylate transport system permease small subunit